MSWLYLLAVAVVFFWAGHERGRRVQMEAISEDLEELERLIKDALE